MAENEQDSKKDTFTTDTSLPAAQWEQKLKANEKPAIVDLPKNQPQPEKPAKKQPHFSMRTLWAGLLLGTFTASAVCGLILTLKPIGPVETKEEKKEDSAITSITSGSKPGVAWIKVYGVIASVRCVGYC